MSVGTNSIANLSDTDMSKFRNFLGSFAQQTGNGKNSDLVKFLQSSDALKFTDQLADGVDSQYNRTTNHVGLSLSAANDAYEAMEQLDKEGLVSSDGTLKQNALTKGKEELSSVSYLDALATHEFRHYRDHEQGLDTNATSLANTILKGNWGLSSDTQGYSRQLVDAAVRATDMTTGPWAQHNSKGDVGNTMAIRILREYGSQLEQEQYQAKLAQAGLMDSKDVEHLVTDGKGTALDVNTAMKNLYKAAQEASSQASSSTSGHARNGSIGDDSEGLAGTNSHVSAADMSDDGGNGDWHWRRH